MSENIAAAQAWNKILENCREKLSRQTISTWFKAAKPLALGPESLKVELATTFNAAHVRKNYQDTVNRIALDVLGREITVDFVSRKDSHRSQMEFWARPQEEQGHKEEGGREDSAEETVVETRNTVLYVGSLNPLLTFDNFVVGKNSMYAHAAAQSVAESPGTAYNPLFLYGGVGLGKTHLMQAVGHELHKKFGSRSMRICYVSAETFTNDMIKALQSRTMAQFHNRYRKMDVLLVDDVEFIAEKEAIQEEFFHTFNALYDSQKQIVLTSDRPPREIEHLAERLSSRFQQGVIADIKPPELETRIAILKKKNESSPVVVPQKVLEFIAENVRSNVRQLEGSLKSLRLFSSTHKTAINLELAERVLKDIFESEIKHISVENVIREVCKEHGITQDALKSSKKTRTLTEPRQLAMYLCRRLTRLSTTEIAEQFNRKDHTTVLHACKKINSRLELDLELEEKIEEFVERLKNRKE